MVPTAKKGPSSSAAIYTRFSSDNQKDSSLEDQERLCREEAKRLGLQVVRVYSDKALSGQLSEDQRPQFREMLEDAKAKQFSVLLVDSISRLSRNTSDAMKLLERFQSWGIGLVGRTDGINTLQN